MASRILIPLLTFYPFPFFLALQVFLYKWVETANHGKGWLFVNSVGLKVPCAKRKLSEGELADVIADEPVVEAGGEGEAAPEFIAGEDVAPVTAVAEEALVA